MAGQESWYDGTAIAKHGDAVITTASQNNIDRAKNNDQNNLAVLRSLPLPSRHLSLLPLLALQPRIHDGRAKGAGRHPKSTPADGHERGALAGMENNINVLWGWPTNVTGLLNENCRVSYNHGSFWSFHLGSQWLAWGP